MLSLVYSVGVLVWLGSTTECLMNQGRTKGPDGLSNRILRECLKSFRYLIAHFLTNHYEWVLFNLPIKKLMFALF